VFKLNDAKDWKEEVYLCLRKLDSIKESVSYNAKFTRILVQITDF